MAINLEGEERREAAESHNINAINSLLNEELSSVEQFVRDLHVSFEIVKQLDENLEQIKRRLEFVRQLFQKRCQLVEALRQHESSEIVEQIKAMDNQMQPLIQVMYSALRKLVLNETHALYSKSEENRKEMVRISEEAKQIEAELNNIREISSKGSISINRPAA